jgi:predicted AAA+ superfamily ATPase
VAEPAVTVIGKGVFDCANAMSIDAGDALVRALHDHNPWWEAGTDAFELPARQKADFYHLARPAETGSQFEDQALLALVGRRGVGKTTLLRQFVHHRLSAGDPPERFLYLPFDADPLYQLRSAEQLRRAVRYYESRILGQEGTEGPQFLLLDDVHQIEHPTKPASPGWGEPVAELLSEVPNRHAVVTASAGVQIDRELAGTRLDGAAYDTQPILPEKFRDYLFALYPELEEGDRRLSPTSLREGPNSLPAAIQRGETDALLAEIQAKYEQVADVERRIQSQVLDYLAMGGTISYAQDGAVETAADLPPRAYHRLRGDVRTALYQEVPGFETIQTIADLERLCALAARTRAAEAFEYQALVDLFDVDRRTITDSYLPALDALYLLNGVTEYDNSRPRSVRLYLRDTGLVTALAEGEPDRVRNDFDREVDLARVAGFDHTMRLEYGINALQGTDAPPQVQFWRGDGGLVDYVFEVDGTPVPVGLAYSGRLHEEAIGAVRAFRRHYDTPVGFVLAGDTVVSNEAVRDLGDGLIELPYWLYLALC